jgi:hypothetical protein
VSPTPTIDDFEDLSPEEVPTVEYKDWREGSTMVLSGPLGSESGFKGRRFATLGAAIRYYAAKHGRVHEAFTAAGGERYYVRVPKPGGTALNTGFKEAE